MMNATYSTEQRQVLQKLRDEFTARCNRNAQYSLRSFAKSLDTSHTVMSLVLNNRRPPSKKLIQKVSSQLGLTNTTDNNFKDIGMEDFSQIATWLHYAILGMLSLPDFKFSLPWMAKRLGIPELNIKLAWQDLERLHLIEKKNRKWQQATPPITVASNKSTTASRKYIRSLLQKADDSLDSVPFEQRNLTAISFAMNTADINVAIEKIKEFRRGLCHELEQRGNANGVYALALQLFPLTKTETI